MDLFKHLTTFKYDRVINSCTVTYPDGKEEHTICFALAKHSNGENCRVRMNHKRDKKTVDVMVEDLGWTPELFDSYLHMMRQLNPVYIPMLEDCVFEEPSIYLCSHIDKHRFIAWCIFRLIYEEPYAAHQLLYLYESGDLDLADISVLGALCPIVSPGHWYCYGAAEKEKLLNKLLNDEQSNGSVDRWLGGLCEYGVKLPNPADTAAYKDGAAWAAACYNKLAEEFGKEKE